MCAAAGDWSSAAIVSEEWNLYINLIVGGGGGGINIIALWVKGGYYFYIFIIIMGKAGLIFFIMGIFLIIYGKWGINMISIMGKYDFYYG